jgi:hypothetical protein
VPDQKPARSGDGIVDNSKMRQRAHDVFNRLSLVPVLSELPESKSKPAINYKGKV